MKVIVCLDDNAGMLFFSKRQSRDKAVVDDINKLTEGAVLAMSQYSYDLFKETGREDINVFSNGGQPPVCDYLFVENPEYIKEDELDEIIVYYWGRKYPSDRRCTVNFDKYTIAEELEFKGNSHDKIIRRRYIPNK